MEDPELVERNGFLIERSQAFLGRFDPAYLELPREVIVTAMREHQFYFAVEDASGRLLPVFVGIRNGSKRGIERVVRGLVPISRTTRWLDFGCGHGGLVRFLRERGAIGAFGYDTGAMVERARAEGIPLLTEDELARAHGSFEVVTAIEVIEHVPDPVELLVRLRRLLAPGGLLFLTTGIGNGSTFRMIPIIFITERQREVEGKGPAAQEQALKDGNKEGAAVLGFSGAIGAYGGFFIPKSYGTSITMTGGPEAALYLFVVFYLTCIAITWWYYARRNAPMPC